MSRVKLLLLPLVIIINQLTFSQTDIPEKLSKGQVIKKEIGGNNAHRYSISLEKDQFFYGVVMQYGIDAIVRVYDPSNEKVAEIDAPTGTAGPENILLTTKASGEYIIEVAPLLENAEKGKYEIRIEKIAPAAVNIEGKIDQLMSVWDKKDSPGAAISIVKDGQVIFEKGYGSANLEYDVPITPTTVFHIASVSKQFTSFAIAMLADQGKLSLNDDIRKYLPEIPDFGKVITINHLVHHTSGLRDQWNLLALAGWRLDDVITTEHIMKLMTKQKNLNTDPGNEFNYCNTGFTLLAEIVSRISGKSFAEWTKENIFDPLGMNNTLFYDDHEKIVKNRAYSFNPAEGGEIKKSVLSYANAGATSLFTTASDLSKWAMNFENPIAGNHKIIVQMEEKGVLNNGDTISYAFGQAITDYKGLKFIVHGGADAGFRSFLGRCPEHKFSVNVLSNMGSFDTQGIAQQIVDLYLGDYQKKEPVTKKEAQVEAEVASDILEQYQGEYELQPGFILNISVEDNKLMVQGTGQPKFQLFAKSESNFFLKVVDAQVDFEKNEKGEVYRLILHQGGQNIPALRMNQDTKEDITLSDYEGEFYSEELGTFYTFIVKDDKLIAQHIRHSDIYLNAGQKDKFSSHTWFFGNVVFERNADNQVVDCKVSSGRVKDVIFVKGRIERGSNE